MSVTEDPIMIIGRMYELICEIQRNAGFDTVVDVSIQVGCKRLKELHGELLRQLMTRQITAAVKERP